MDSLSELLDVSPNVVLVVDEQGVIQQANRNVSDILGYDPSELEGTVVEELLLEDDRDDHVTYRQQYVEDPEPRPMGDELDLYALHADGSRVPVEISLGPFEHDGDLHVAATIADITKRKQREAELQRKNERLEEFASIVSHDLRNPLNVAEGRIELLMEEYDSDHLDAIHRALERIETLIEDLLTLAHEGESVNDVRPVELAALVEDCWTTVDTEGGTLVCDVEGTIPADEGQLKQVFENLMRNAIEHGDEAVTLTVGDLDDGFYIEDDGPGIPADDRDVIFDTDYSTTEVGTGIGLHIVEQVVEAHDWEIRVTEGSEGGARFEITDVEFATG